MSKFFTVLFSGVLCVALAGCSDEAQLDSAVENFNEERAEVGEEMGSAMADGVVDADELEEVQDEREDTIEAAGEVAEQRGDLIEEKTD